MQTQYAGRAPLPLGAVELVLALLPLSAIIDTEMASATACQVGTLACDTVRLSSPRYELHKLTTVPLLLNGGSFSKALAPPLFLEDENFFSKISHVGTIQNSILDRTNVADF
jgi:hypothetical protein